LNHDGIGISRALVGGGAFAGLSPAAIAGAGTIASSKRRRRSARGISGLCAMIGTGWFASGACLVDYK
jgi:hypothetical protein